MQKASVEMDLGEWVLVDDRFYEFPKKPIFRPNGIVDMNYFSSNSEFSSYPSLIPKHYNRGENLLDDKQVEAEEEVKDVPVVEISVVAPSYNIRPYLTGDQDLVSKVFFNKMKKNSDMKIDSPPRTPSREPKQQFDMGLIQFEREDSSEDVKVVDYEEKQEEESKRSEKMQGGCREGGAINIWKWKVQGLGALCSLGVAAAATICIFIVGSRQRQSRLQDQRPRIQIHHDDKVQQS